MPRVIWRPEALDHLDEIANYIEQFNPSAADRTYYRLRQLGDSLKSSPHCGRPMAQGRRQLVTARPYILTYEVIDDTFFIVRIRHSARRPID